MTAMFEGPDVMTTKHHFSQGFALVAALLMLLILSAFSAAIVFLANSETQTHTTDLENTQVYYTAEAGMEKMMVDLNNLFLANKAPSVSQIQAVGATPPTLAGYSYTEYQLIVPNTGGVPTYSVRTISGGPNQGLIAQVLPITLAVTARAANGAEIRMTRDIELALIPVFQFGMFSDTDLSFFPGGNITFAGRIHTNGSLFLAADDPVSCFFRGKLSAAKEVIRYEQANGTVLASTAQNGAAYIPTGIGGCDAGVASSTCINLALNEGSRVQGPTSSVNSSWNSISTTRYNSMVVNGATGAKALALPFVNSSLTPIEIIRRPPAGEDPTTAIGLAREYNLAQIRILLADTVDELPGGSAQLGTNNIQLANVGPYAAGVPVPGALNTYFAEGKYFATNTGGSCTEVTDIDWIPPSTPGATGCTSWNLIDGFLRVEVRQSTGWAVVTQEWLELGFARGLSAPNSEAGVANSVHPNAILLFQQQADRNNDGDVADAAVSGSYVAETASFIGSSYVNSWFPINVYDAQQGELRAGGSNTSCALGGIMNMVELDVGNLKRWLAGTIGTNGSTVDSVTQNGYVLYFSDRRGQLGPKNGEYGYEDMINPSDSTGAANGVLDAPEDVNDNATLDVYGRANLGDGFIASAQGGDTANDNPRTRVSPAIARKNRPTGARHALKLVNGSLGNLPSASGGAGGFTVVSENPVHIRGNYNASNSGFVTAGHVAAAVVADSVVTLSRNWSDRNSFLNPTSASGRPALTTYHRVAICGGKNKSFAHPAWDTSTDIGTDGGTHNYMRYLESWSGQTHYYSGSMVSLYYARYNNSVYIPGSGAYSPPTRNYQFDTDFLDPNKVPPGTPRFQDVVNLGYKQVFAP